MGERKIKFVKEGVGFIAILMVVLLTANLSYLKFIEPRKLIERKEVSYDEFIASLKDRELDIAFFGDCHPQSDLNPFYIANSYSFADGGESYVETYYKLKKIIEKDKVQIKNIVLQVDLHNFSAKARPKERLFGQLYFYSQFVSLKDIAKLKNESLFPLILEKNIPVLGNGKEFIQSMLRLEKAAPIYLGRPMNSDEVQLRSMSEMAKAAYLAQFTEEEPLKIDQQTFHYFLEILRIAKENKMNVIFVKYPLSKEYNLEIEKHNLARKEYYDEIFSEVDKVIEKYVVLDYYDIFFDKPEYFNDSEHLNNAGAAVFSQKLNEDIAKMLKI